MRERKESVEKMGRLPIYVCLCGGAVVIRAQPAQVVLRADIVINTL